MDSIYMYLLIKLLFVGKVDNQEFKNSIMSLKKKRSIGN